MNAIYCRLAEIEPNTKIQLIDSPSDHVSSRIAQIYVPEGHVMISQWDPQIYGFQSKPPTTFIILYLAMRKISSMKHRCNVFLTCLHPCPYLMIFNGSHYYFMEIKIKIYIMYKGSIAGRMSHDRWQRKVVTSRHQSALVLLCPGQSCTECGRCKWLRWGLVLFCSLFFFLSQIAAAFGVFYLP